MSSSHDFEVRYLPQVHTTLETVSKKTSTLTLVVEAGNPGADSAGSMIQGYGPLAWMGTGRVPMQVCVCQAESL